MRLPTHVLRLLLVLVLIAVGATAAACASDTTTDQGEDVASMEFDEATCGEAYVDFVSVQEADDGAYVAIAQGHYPSACDELGAHKQEVDGDTIKITMCSTRPADEACAMMLTPFTETIPIETDELEAGEYVVVVNERSEDANQTQAVITID